jgi:hypothetical protein
MNEKSDGTTALGISRRQVINGAAAAIAAGAAARLISDEASARTTPPPPPPPPPHEKNRDLFLVLTFWLAATNYNLDINNLQDATLQKMGLNSSGLIGKLRNHVSTHPALYALIRQEFLTIESLYGYQPTECPANAETLSGVAKLPVP